MMLISQFNYEQYIYNHYSFSHYNFNAYIADSLLFGLQAKRGSKNYYIYAA